MWRSGGVYSFLLFFPQADEGLDNGAQTRCHSLGATPGACKRDPSDFRALYHCRERINPNQGILPRPVMILHDMSRTCCLPPSAAASACAMTNTVS